MSASAYRCSKCQRIGIAAIGDDRTGQQIKPVGESFDIDSCGGRLVVITPEEFAQLQATAS